MRYPKSVLSGTVAELRVSAICELKLFPGFKFTVVFAYKIPMFITEIDVSLVVKTIKSNTHPMLTL